LCWGQPFEVKENIEEPPREKIFQGTKDAGYNCLESLKRARFMGTNARGSKEEGTSVQNADIMSAGTSRSR
jgi:hypothetical protein